MNDKDWELLLALYEEGTITRAAEKVYMSQPALTYRIRHIERKFNTKVIVRSNKGVIFTKEGEYLVNHAKKLVKELRVLQDNLNNMNENVQGTLRIGVSNIFALYKLPVILEGFLAKYPEVEVKLTTGWSYEILKPLQNEEIHLAIIRGDHNWPDQKILLNKETICIASKGKLDLSELPSLNLINYQTDTHLKNTVDEWWRETYSVPPNISMQVDRIETCKELVKRGLGYAIFPSICIQEVDNLQTIDLKRNGRKIYRKTWLLHRDEFAELNVLNAFTDFVRDFYQLDHN